MCIRRIPALAFARPADVHDLFDQVAMDLPLTSEIGELVDYFERTYIGRTLASGYHVAATFPIDLWNYHLSTPFGLPVQPTPWRHGTTASMPLSAAITPPYGSSS
ncbi:hypothetical protein LOD99_12346 [Oopsacas minuta]|nr:hypothetical protein LOD99_12346 [Oopsacas minuta]